MDGDDMQWFRWWHDGTTDGKLLRLTYAQRWIWLAILTTASASPKRGSLYESELMPSDVRDVARKANVPLEMAEETIAIMLNKPYNMLTTDEKGAWAVTNWEKYQPGSDNSAERTRKWRGKTRTSDDVVTSRDGHSDGHGDDVVTPPDTDTDTDIKHTEIVSLWNEICGQKLHLVTSLTPTRQKHLKARLSTKGRDLAWWRAYFTRIVSTPFLTGQSGRGWKAGFDFAVRSETEVAKVMEGQYGEVGSTPTTTPTKPWDRVYRAIDEFSRE